MIKVEQNSKDHTLMDIVLKGNGEQVAQEYVALTMKLADEFPVVLERAQWYLEDIQAIRKIMREEGNQ